MDTQKTRSNAPARTASSTAARPAAQTRASQAAQARVAEAPKTKPVPQPSADKVDVDQGGDSQAGSLLQGLSASFHPSGDWGQGYFGINGNSVQFSLDTEKTQIQGAGEGHTGFRNGSAFAEGTVNGVVNDKPFDASGDARIQLGPHFDAKNETTRNDDGSTTWNARLVLPTPFGFSLGGGFNVRYGGD